MSTDLLILIMFALNRALNTLHCFVLGCYFSYRLRLDAAIVTSCGGTREVVSSGRSKFIVVTIVVIIESEHWINVGCIMTSRINPFIPRFSSPV